MLTTVGRQISQLEGVCVETTVKLSFGPVEGTFTFGKIVKKKHYSHRLMLDHCEYCHRKEVNGQ